MKTIDISIKIGILLIAASVLAQRCCLLMVKKLSEPTKRTLPFPLACALNALLSLLLSLSIQTSL